MALSQAPPELAIIIARTNPDPVAPIKRPPTLLTPRSSPTATGDVEGFGIAILEANALGIPAIGALGCGIEDAIENYSSGILINYLDTEAFKNALSGCNLNLRCIGLNHCDGMNSGVMKTIVEVLAANPSITELHLDKYDMDKEVVVILGNALCTNISLKKAI